MNHWYTADQLAASRRADLGREAAGDVRMHASLLAAGENISGDRSGREGGSRLSGRLRLTSLWSVLTGLIDSGRHAAALIDRRRSGISDGR